MDTTKETLYCIGCGRIVAHVSPGQSLAIACVCGASAPILHTKDNTWAPPFSLVRATGATIPHLEYYLGFSDHESQAKTAVIQMLRAFGSISYKECTEPECRANFERGKLRYEIWLARQEER